MTCDDCPSGDCRGSHGPFSESTGGDSIAGDASCELNNTWDITHTVNPENGSTESYDVVKGSYKHIFLNSYFTDTPEEQIEQSCEDQIGSFSADPTNVEYYARHPSSETDSEYQFADPRPTGDGNYSTYVISSLIAIAGGITTNPLAAAGAAAISAYLGSFSSSSVDLGPYNPDPDRQKIHWDLDYNSSQGFPTSPCDTTGVRFDIEPGVNTGDHDVNTWTRYTFSTTEYRDGYECACDYDALSGYSVTTDWLSNHVTFTFDS